MEKVADCIPIKSIDIHYQVRCFDGGQYTVDLQHYTCTCRAWQLSGIPCTHSLCAILSEGLDPDDFVHKFYTIDMYKVAYQYPIYGISYDALWGESLYIPPLPPDFGRKSTKGKRVKKRRREEDESVNKQKKGTRLKKQQKTVKCRRCGLKGHNSLTCVVQRDIIVAVHRFEVRPHPLSHVSNRPSIPSVEGTNYTKNIVYHEVLNAANGN
ncbi:hypothetical protein ACS0TY_029493 [Phlomoides rotata]